MASEAATSGKVAKLTAGADAIEIKATIPERQVAVALERYRLTEDNDEERYIYFFDTPALDLLEAGIIARARRVVGDEHDSTIKLRPVDPAQVPNRWRKYRGFKIEADASEKNLVKSASFTIPVAKGLIKRVVAGEAPIASLFSQEQQLFLLSMANRKIDYSKVIVLGPLSAHVWKFEEPACPWPLTAELWRREDGATLVEASIKAPIVQAAAAMAGFMAFLAEVGAERDNRQQAKTRWALDYYAGAARKGSARTHVGAAGAKRDAAPEKVLQ